MVFEKTYQSQKACINWWCKVTRCVLIIGCGYIGEKVAQKEIAAGAEVHAIVKSCESANRLIQKGIKALALDIDVAYDRVDALTTRYDAIYYLLPPQADGHIDLRIQKFFILISDRKCAAKLVLISTTGVYGDCAGEWVDESRKPNPVVARAHRRLSAEQQCVVWASHVGAALAILRVGGIYGAGKLPLKRLRRGDPVLALDESPWSNRIYAPDLVVICLRVAQSDVVGVLNVVDGSPSTMTEYFLRIADFVGIRRPVQITMADAQQQLGQGILSYLAESRRIGNRRLIEELGADCVRFPTLVQGLADIKYRES